MSNATWVFEKSSRMGGAAGEAYSNILESSGMHPAGVLAREAVQNSVDAKHPDVDKVSMNFIARAIEGPAKSAFVEAAALDRLESRRSSLKLRSPNCLEMLGDEAKPLNLLYIEDHGTTGLEGDPSDPDSKFYRFLLSLGDGGKEHEEHGTGGSYGYGKSVYSSNSSILTIWAYSKTEGPNGITSLLFGCSYFKKHEFDEGKYTGRAWFGLDDTEDGPYAQQIVEPLLGAEADERAASLGFRHRSDADLGTTVLIVDCSLSPKEIVKGIEDWWWPRIVDQLLDVVVEDADTTVMHPRPKKRADLMPFIAAYQVALGRDPPKPKIEAKKVFNKLDNTPMGQIGLTVLERDEDDNFAVSDERLDSVALIRNPLMVVAYYRQWQTQIPAVVGAFVGADEIDDILRSSEPPAHDRWDSEARRLQEPTGFRKKVVASVLARIRTSLKQFQSSAAPPPSPKPRRLKLLERTLASFLKASSSGGSPGPEANAAPISLTYIADPSVAPEGGGRVVMSAKFAVKAKEEHSEDGMAVRVRARCVAVEDGQAGDSIPMSVSCSAGAEADESGWMELELTSDAAVKFECVTEPYDNTWSVRFIPEVQPMGGVQ